MDREAKTSLKIAVANKLRALPEREGITIRDLITTSPEIVHVLTMKGYEVPNQRDRRGKQSVDYIRRLIHEIRAEGDGGYGLEHIRSALINHPVYYKGRKKPVFKKEWIWINVENNEGMKQAIIRDYIVKAGKLIKTAGKTAEIIKVERDTDTEIGTIVDNWNETVSEEKKVLVVKKNNGDSSTTTTDKGDDDDGGDNDDNKEETVEEGENYISVEKTEGEGASSTAP